MRAVMKTIDKMIIAAKKSLWGAWAATATVSLTASADVVLWHHYDERVSGESTQAADVLVNAVSSEYGNGTAYSMMGNTRGSDPDFMPVYGDPLSGFPNVIEDPVSGAVHTNRSAMSFRTSGTTSALNGGGIVIADCTELRLTNYTVECFVCTTGGTFNTIAPIVGKPRNSSSSFSDGGFLSESWQIGLLTNGKLFMRYSGANSGTGGDGSHSISDGFWHHVALTCSYDESNNVSTYKMYVDHELDFTKTKEGVTSYYTLNQNYHNEIYVGGYLHSGRKFNGQIDELRISDTALPPEHFLRRHLPSFIDGDTLVWMPFDGLNGTQVKTNQNQNMIFGKVTAIAVKRGDVPDPILSDDTVTAKLRIVADESSVSEDFTSIFLQTNGVAENGSAVSLSSYAYAKTNFTAEIFFKAAGRMAKGESQTLLKLSSEPVLQLTLDNTAPGKMILVYSDLNKGTTSGEHWTNAGTFGANLDDGEWHHVAVVYDAVLSSVKLYIDYALVASKEGVRLSQASVAGCVGARTPPTGQFFHGWIDSVRLTKRALSPTEFLFATSGNAYPVQDDTVFYAPLDDNLEAYSGGVLIRGSGYAHAEGDEAPTFTNLVRYAELLHDGAGGVNVATNKGSVLFKGSTVFFQGAYSLGAYDQTAEVFCKLSDLPRLAGIMRVNTVPAGADYSTPMWALYRGENGNMYFRLSTVTNGVVSSERYIITDVHHSRLSDDQWHHVAVTAQAVDDGENTQMTLYIDGAQAYSKKISGTLHPGTTGNAVALGAASQHAAGGVSGCFDEFRISRGVLPTSRFLCRYKRPRGLIVNFR